MTATDVAEGAARLLDGFEHVETVREFEERLRLGRPLRVKLGLDPTKPDLHLGHAVTLHKLQQFVDAGHGVTLVIGDFTTRIGDPSGRNDARPALTVAEIEANMATYATQAGTVLDMSRVDLRYNSEWLGPLTFADLIRLGSQITVAQMLKREDFAKRYADGVAISLHELLYPIAQAYDSVVLDADVEIGGNDQLWNFLVARQFQAAAGQRSQICATLPLLEGLDGIRKMSKSFDNYIGVVEPPNEQFGKIMSIPDEMIARYARLADFQSREAVAALAAGVETGKLSPMDEKKRLAEAIVARYHDASAARAARDFFERTVQRKEVPAEIPEMQAGAATRVADILLAATFAKSKREAQRLIGEGGVRIDGVVVDDPAARWTSESPAVVQVGTRRYVRVLPNER